MNFGFFHYICCFYFYSMKKFFLTIFSLLCIVQLSAQANFKELQEEYAKLGRVLYSISNQYVDTVNLHKLVEKMVINTLHQLDPHSTYISVEDVDASNEPLQGSFDGIGVEFNILNDTLTVVNAMSGGPSELVGIRAGDRIISVDEENIAGIGIKNDRVFKLLRGPKGTKVTLDIQRAGVKELLTFVVTRDKIPIYSVDAIYEIRPGIVFVRLNKFAVTSLNEIRSGLAKLKNKPTAMILDLRSNSGGVFPVAVELADQFFDAGKLLTYTEGANWRQSPEISTNSGFFKEGKLAVLIDEYSASASEIVSGAVQDWDRGVIIGRRSFGKGLVQQLITLPDGSQMRLTVSRYHTPTGRAIQRPYDSEHIDGYYADLYKRLSGGERYHKDSIRFPDSLKYYTLIENREVYGGGGIMPDVFIPLDTSYYSNYYGKLLRLGMIYQFSLQYMDKYRNNFKKTYKDFNSFDNKFEVSDALFNELISYAETKDIAKDEEGIQTSQKQIRRRLKAEFARLLWGVSEYFQVINKEDETVAKAIELMSYE